jgi:hypothetical protein
MVSLTFLSEPKNLRHHQECVIQLRIKDEEDGDWTLLMKSERSSASLMVT